MSVRTRIGQNNAADTVNITPLIPNSPVVNVVKEFIEALYNNYNLDMPSTRDIEMLNAFLKARKPRLVRAMREILADDAAILVTKKLPDDRTRMIGTKRGVVL